jgi:amino acid adenylation domain-containing protein
MIQSKDVSRRAQRERMASPSGGSVASPERSSRVPSPPEEPRPRDGLLHRIFESQADARPRSIALLWDDKVTAYCVLEARANRLARHLRSRGIGAGSLVAILLRRSPEAYVALLATLKAGGACVPLDPAWTEERTAYILHNSGAAALVTTETLHLRHAGFRGQVVRVDSDGDAILAQSPMRLSRAEVGVKAEDLCYVLYSSSFAARPKGVMVEHRNAAHLARAERWLCSMRPEDRVYQGASLAQGRSLEEMWLAFSAGATLVPRTPEMARSGPDLPQLLARREVTVLSSVPTLLSTMEGDVPSLRLLILGGGSCPPALVRRWSRPGLRILATYGPAEAGVVSTSGEIRAGRPVTLGTPIPGSRVYLMDEKLRPVARSEAGEICIAGGGVGRGYLGDPEETQRRFLRDPFASREDRPSRLFRTGDYGRLDWEGNLHLLGRGDWLPGLPGFKGDPAVIESALLEKREILAAACGACEDASGTPRLAAYVVMRRGVRLDETAVRDHLRRRLPPDAIPRIIEAVPGLPLLSDGQLDRLALVRPRLMPAPAASSETQRRVLAIWKALLRPREVAPESHFFLDLGGDSLLAARMISELHRIPEFAPLSRIDVYRHPTVASLARALDAHREEALAREEPERVEPRGWRRLLIHALRALGWDLPESRLPGRWRAGEAHGPREDRRAGKREGTYDERGQGSVA